MSKTGGSRAKCLSLAVVVGVDDADRFFDSHVDDELTNAELLVGRKGQLGGSLGAHGSVGVVPHVEDAELDESVDPGFVDQVVEIGFADAGTDSGDDVVVDAVVNAGHRFVEHFLPTAALVADDFATFDADERRNITTLAELSSDLGGNEVAVGENLKIAIGMAAEDFQDVGMHEGFAADDTEEVITC